MSLLGGTFLEVLLLVYHGNTLEIKEVSVWILMEIVLFYLLVSIKLFKVFQSKY